MFSITPFLTVLSANIKHQIFLQLRKSHFTATSSHFPVYRFMKIFQVKKQIVTLVKNCSFLSEDFSLFYASFKAFPGGGKLELSRNVPAISLDILSVPTHAFYTKQRISQVKNFLAT